LRPTPISLRIVASAALAIAAGACADVATQPDASGARSVHFDLVDSTVAAVDSTQLVQLLSCSTTDSASARATIGPAGGTIGARGASITIPAGAVPEPTLFEVVVPVSKYLETDIHAVGVEHYVFQQPASITLNLARCPGALPGGASPQGAYIDTATDQVLELMGGSYDLLNHKVTFRTGHLSGYVVAY
jgi:hypothetical protein